jgi:hypothetical protein
LSAALIVVWSDLWLDSTKLHFFDAQSGEALTYRR